LARHRELDAFHYESSLLSRLENHVLSIKYTALLIVPAAVAMVILSRDLIFAIYGPSYSLAPLLSTYAMFIA
jgi:O-antigen/teichoic acid export membrane protein